MAKNSVTVTNQENGGDVVLVVKKKKFPWWILLFLLPLILLIPLKRDINIVFLEEGTKIAVSQTHAQALYPVISTFGKVTEETFAAMTDDNGRFVIKDAKYPLWYKFFGGFLDSVAVSCGNTCQEVSGKKYAYNEFPENDFKEVLLSAKTSVETLRVVDLEDSEPLPDANVTIISTVGSSTSESSTTTDVSGMVDINSMPVCGSVKVIASREGYENDTIEATLFDLNNMGEHEKTLRLRPLKGCVKVVVKNLKTKTLLAGATVSLVIQGQSQTLKTNTNGVGIGQFDSLRIGQQLNFNASKSGYADTSLTGYSVKDFMNLDEEKRTMYLRPLTSSLVFINTDNNNVLEGVTNKIYKNGNLIATEYSNNKGEFIVSDIGQNDKISIIASKTGYSTNSTKVKNQTLANLSTQASRTIPLTKNEVKPIPTPPVVDNNTSDLKGQSGDLRVNLQWYTKTDLDLHVIDPCGNEIYFSKRRAICSGGAGTLDLDANALFGTTSRPQENIYWNSPAKGTYTIKVHCFKWRERVSTPITYNVTVIDKGVRSDKRGQISSGQNILVLKHTVN